MNFIRNEPWLPVCSLFHRYRRDACPMACRSSSSYARQWGLRRKERPRGFLRLFHLGLSMFMMVCLEIWYIIYCNILHFKKWQACGIPYYNQYYSFPYNGPILFPITYWNGEKWWSQNFQATRHGTHLWRLQFQVSKEVSFESGDLELSYLLISMDWFKGFFTGNHRF